MISEHLKTKWQQDFDQAVASIESYLTRRNDSAIYNWLITSDRMMIYGILPEWNKMGTVFAVDSLFHRIDHALFDDADICFLTLYKDGEPLETRMDFIDPYEVKETDTHYFQDIMDINHRSDEFTNEILGKPLPSYTVTAHRDPVKFMQDVEAIHVEKERTRIENDAWLKDYYAKQIDKP